MKLLRPLPMLAGTVAMAAGGFVYRDNQGNVTLSAVSGSLTTTGSAYHFRLVGSVTASSRKEGITISAREVSGDAVPSGKETRISRATATGGTRVAKTSAAGSSTLAASRADYTDRGSGALVVATGGVRITSQSLAKHQYWVITGPSGQATLDAPGAHGSGLRTAVLDGGAKIQLSQARGGTMTATGRRVSLDNTSQPATVTLTGDVKVQGTGQGGFGSLQNAKRAVLRLNEKGEVVSSEVSS